jgi:hypothetical protein
VDNISRHNGHNGHNGHAFRDTAVFVLATSEAGTQHALRCARSLAQSDDVPLVLLVPVETAYGPVPQRVPASCAEVEHFRRLARQTGFDVKVHACSCREAQHVFGRLLIDAARVVIGGRHGHWRRSPEERLARTLQLEGHDVTFVDVDAR